MPHKKGEKAKLFCTVDCKFDIGLRNAVANAYYNCNDVHIECDKHEWSLS